MPFLKSLSGRVLIALALGLSLGALVQSGTTPQPWLVSTAEAVGSVWLGGLQMTVIPLVVALLVVGVGKVADAMSAGRLTARAIVWFTVLLVAAIVLTLVGVQTVLALWPVDPDSARALIAGASGADAPPPPQPIEFGAWLRSLAPSNPVAAAADNAILPLVIFALSSQVIGQGLLVYSIGVFPPLVVGLALLTQPAVSAAIGWFAYGETLSAADWVGAFAIAAALVLVRLPQKGLRRALWQPS